jgi:release factor glutamine methyltransferase
VNRRQALTQARRFLADAGIDDASLEGEILLRHVLGIDRTRFFSDLDGDVSLFQEEELNSLVERRLRGEPSAYITGHREFYGLDFIIDRHVLIPRPETELIVEKAISLCQNHAVSTIADIGTGCGAIAVSLAVNLPVVTIYATDISVPALKIAGQNCVKHGVKDRIILLQGDLLEPLPAPVDMIVANLPYVSQADLTSGAEPEMALNGGEKGLDTINVLCQQAGEKLYDKGILLLEVGQGQADAVRSVLHNTFLSASIEIDRDLAGIERVVSLRLT